MVIFATVSTYLSTFWKSHIQNHTRSGGLMSKNFTQGYGPVEYLTRDAAEGVYRIRVKLFSPKIASGSVSVCVRIYLHYGQANEEEYVTVAHLSTPKEVVEVATVTFH